MNKFLLVLLIVLPLLLIVSPARAEVASGFAWMGANDAAGGTTKPVGWVSFNSTFDQIGNCFADNYAVDVNYNTGEIDGPAWIGVGEDDDPTDCNTTESSVGFIDFTDNTTPSFSDSYNYNYEAQVVNQEIRGWAPIVSEDESGNKKIVTWLRFKGTNYSNVITSNGTIGDSDSSHYAWSGYGDEGGLGWIDMNPYRDDSNIPGDERPPGLSEDDTVQFPEFNHDPIISNLTADTQRISYCASQPAHTFSWNFEDVESDQQGAYRIQVGSYDSGKVQSSSNDQMQVNLYEFGEFNNSYNVEVTVYDGDGGTDSASTGFETPDHRYPAPAFDPSTKSPEAGTKVVFEDESYCYSLSGDDYCSASDFGNADKIYYRWDFNYEEGNFTTNSIVKGDASTTYSTSTARLGDKVKVNLRVQDTSLDNDPWCETIEELNVILPLPEWREVGSD